MHGVTMKFIAQLLYRCSSALQSGRDVSWRYKQPKINNLISQQ